MPTPHHLKNLAVPANRYKLSEAAREGLLIHIKCKRCFRTAVVFFASDLVQVIDPDRDCFDPPFPCSKCGNTQFIEITLRAPEEAAVGKLVVRRLTGIKQVPVWRNELLGDRPA